MVEAWAFSLSQHAKAAVNSAESYLKEYGLKLLKIEGTLMHTSFRPELEASPKLGPKESTHFHSLIRMQHLMV